MESSTGAVATARTALETDTAGPYIRLRRHRDAIVCEGVTSYFRGLQTVPAGQDCPFAAWRWNGSSLDIENDRYGFYPLYYYSTAEEFVVSPSIRTLLRNGAPTEIDWEALAVFLRTAYYVGCDTPFRHIRLFPPSARVRWNDGRFSVLGERVRVTPDYGLSRNSAIDAYIRLFREAVAHMPAAEQALVPLSGGRDSRHVLLELVRQRTTPISALTVRYEPYIETEDLAVAKALAAEVGAQHWTLEVPGDTVLLERRKNRLTEMVTLEHRWIISAADQICGRQYTVYEGVAGDTLSTGWGLNPERLRMLEHGDLSGVADSYLDEGYIESAIAPDALKRVTREAARQRLVTELRDHLDAANPLGSFHFWNRTRRVTGLAPSCIWRLAAPIWCPYLYRPLFDFLCTIPAQMLADRDYQRFHSDAIVNAYPERAHVPFAGKMPTSARATSFNRRAAANLARYTCSPSNGQLLRRSFPLVRSARALIDPVYARSVPSFLPVTIYLKQLEYCIEGRLDRL